MVYEDICKNLIWKYYIKSKLDLILKSEKDPKIILINVPKSLIFFNQNVLSQLLDDYGDLKLETFDPTKLTKLPKEVSGTLIIYNDNIIDLEKVYKPYIKNYLQITIREDDPLGLKHIFYLLKKILKNIKKSSFYKFDIEPYQDFFKLEDLTRITNNIEVFLNKLNIRDYFLNLDNFSLSYEFLYILLKFVIEETFCVIDYRFLQHIRDFFNLSIGINYEADKSIPFLFTSGFICEIQEDLFIEAELWKYYLEKYNLAEVVKLPFRGVLNSEIWCIKPTFLWIYVQSQLETGNLSWIDEILFSNHFDFNERITNDLKMGKNEFNKDYENYFWIKVLIYSDGLKNLNENTILPSRFLGLFGNVIRKILRMDIIKEFIDITHIPQVNLLILLKKLKLDIKMYDKAFNRIPKKTYKPDFLDNKMNIELNDKDIFKNFPELFLFKFLSWQHNDQIDTFLFSTLVNESTSLHDLLKYLGILRYYKLVLKKSDFQLSFNNIPFNEFINSIINFVVYRIWNKFNENLELLNENFINLKNHWLFYYYLLNKSHEYFDLLNLLHGIISYLDIKDLYIKIADRFSIPCKIFTEFLLFDSKIFANRDEKILELNKKKSFLIIIDGLSYSIAKELDYSDTLYDIVPVKIDGITKTRPQLRKIWDLIFKSKNEIVVGCDLKISKEKLFKGFVDDLNDYVISNGYFELFQNNLNTLLGELDENKFYFLYISNFERLNERISDKSLILEKYNQIIKRLLKDLIEILDKVSTFEIYITSDHGSLYVRENATYEEIFVNLLKEMNQVKLKRKNTTRSYFLEDPSQSDKSLSFNKIFSLSIKNRYEKDNTPLFSLIPGVLLKLKSKGISKYDHSGISLEENLVPWIIIKGFQKK